MPSTRPGPDTTIKAGDRPRERGIALLVVLWIIASATLMVVSFNATVRSGVSFVTSEVGLSRTESGLEAGIEIAAARLIDEDAGRRWLPDGIPRSVPFAGVQLRIRILDPNGLVDLNKADDRLLLEFFQQFTDTTRARLIRDRIRTARDEASGKRPDVRTPGNGQSTVGDTEDGPHAPAFMDVAQLRQIEGMTLDLYKTVAPFLTVYSRDGDINPLSAPVEVLSSAPDLKGVVDFRKKREAFLSGNLDEAQPLDPKNPDTDDHNGFGPAYIVLVETAAPGEKYSAGKTFVIATGVDTDAPFRVLSVRPVPPNELEQARRETSND